MSLVPVQEYASLAEMQEAARARRQRLGFGVRTNPAFDPPAVKHEPKPATEDESARAIEGLLARYRLIYSKDGLSPRNLARTILLEEAEAAGLTPSDIMSDSRGVPVVRARQRAIWRVAGATGWSTPQIGAFFGRDHTTVIHAIRCVNKLESANVRGLGGPR